MTEPKGNFKYAGHSGPHPTLVVACATCGAPVMCYCAGDDGLPVDRPHAQRRRDAGTMTWRIESERGTPLSVGMPSQRDAEGALRAIQRFAAELDDVPEVERALVMGARVREEA